MTIKASHVRTPGDAYTEFAKTFHQRHQRGSAGTIDIDRAPMLMEDVAEYFTKLDPAKLAGVWVAVVIDAATRAYKLGELNRALIVVAERLHQRTES